ncbi:MAG: hypothetical protein M3Y21_05095 [Candidatus Eremiobacteraeota bacterium]|nr:hypothetical protein [Candidatus Eremiobacteraeota bacterium]
MTDLLNFFRECAASGTLIASVCGLLFVPFFAWLGVRALATRILRMHDDAGWQAPLAAIAATIPGAAFLSLGIAGLLGASSSGCLRFFWGRVLFATIVAALTFAFSRAALRAYRRSSDIRRLIGASVPADSVTESIALRCGVRVRVLDHRQPFCALAGLWNPLVLLSRGSLDRLDEEEVEASLRHERAHAVRLDLMLAAMLSFFADLLPLPASDLIAAYRTSREIAADGHAVRNCSPHALASAILALAAPRTISAAAALAEDAASLRSRVTALLSDDAELPVPKGRRVLAIAGLSAIIAVSALPVVLSALNFYACTASGVST